jgi:hypothetical protein
LASQIHLDGLSACRRSGHNARGLRWFNIGAVCRIDRLALPWFSLRISKEIQPIRADLDGLGVFTQNRRTLGKTAHPCAGVLKAQSPKGLKTRWSLHNRMVARLQEGGGTHKFLTPRAAPGRPQRQPLDKNGDGGAAMDYLELSAPTVYMIVRYL